MQAEHSVPKIIAVWLAILFVGVLLFFIYYYLNPKEEVTFCTQEAKLCPDGSYVGRSGTNCEFVKCPDANGNNGFKTSGTVYGKVSIGPLCPVEPCSNPIDPYSGKQLIFTPAGGGRPVDTPFYAKLSGDGSFSVDIPESNYSVTLSDCQYLGCQRVFPKNISVSANKSLQLNLDIDTGIR